MKCPKCHYLGFETGDRCKNCGYDFSLIGAATNGEDDLVDLTLYPADLETTPDAAWIDSVDLHAQEEPIIQLETPAVVADVPTPALPVAATAPEPKLPLFSPVTEEDGDEPLIKLPVAPRPPLAVRRAPEQPRLRAVPKPAPRVLHEPEPVLAFQADQGREVRNAPAPAVMGAGIPAQVSAPPARLAAVAVDHAILFGIDLIVVYLTLRMAGLRWSEFALLPFVPLASFLVLVKLFYFCAFTALGGQTIGKMAAHLRVVTDTGDPVNGVDAIRRTAAGALSAAVLGAGFLPALIGPDRRALHDRLAGTRVVSQHSA